jgi:hypothetical protein
MTDKELDAIRMRLERGQGVEKVLSPMWRYGIYDFIDNAPQDISDLLDEIDSLHKQNAEIQRVCIINHNKRKRAKDELRQVQTYRDYWKKRAKALENALEIFGKKTCPTCVFKEECEENIFGEDDEKRKPCMKASNWQFDQVKFLKED